MRAQKFRRPRHAGLLRQAWADKADGLQGQARVAIPSDVIVEGVLASIPVPMTRKPKRVMRRRAVDLARARKVKNALTSGMFRLCGTPPEVSRE